MTEFYFHHRRSFFRRRWGLRHAFAGLAAFVLIYNVVLSFRTPDAEPPAMPAAPVQVAFLAPQPNEIEPRAGAPAEKPAFTPAAVAPAVETRPPLAAQISSVPSGLAAILETDIRPLLSEKKVIVGKGDTLMSLLVNKASIPREEAYQAIQALSKVYNPRDLNPGRAITIFFHKDPAVTDPRFNGLRIERDIVNTVTVNRDDSGRYTAKKAEKGLRRSLRSFRVPIDNSLYVDAKAQGVPDGVILDLIKMYSWNVDFQRDIHPGDGMEVLYEEYRTEDGQAVPGKGNIIYAQLVLKGNGMPFYRYQDKNGDVDYYDDSGRSAKKPLMKTPIDGARLSSGFGMRQHPILGFTKMHKGVDFAAPRGTPIYAAGDGTIVKIGPFSSYGNYVRIRHRSGLETAYAHMKGFKSGLHSGSRVKQGQVIGYVGTTGRSTGPHLHYEVIVNNAQINPAAVKMPTGKALKGKDLAAFKAVMASAQESFQTQIGKTTVAFADTGRGGRAATKN